MSLDDMKMHIKISERLDELIDIAKDLAQVAAIHADLLTTAKSSQYSDFQRKKKLGELYVKSKCIIDKVFVKWQRLRPLVVDRGLEIDKLEKALKEAREYNKKLKKLLK